MLPNVCALVECWHDNGHNNLMCVFYMWGCCVCDGCKEYLKLCSTQANEISTFKAQAKQDIGDEGTFPCPTSTR
jgi:hypothetical protein